MKQFIIAGASLLALAALSPSLAQADDTASKRFTAERVFDIEYASDPQISPDGKTIAYVRRSMDRQTDTDRGDIWTLDIASGAHRPLIVGGSSKGGPRWSPDGTQLLYSTATDGRPDLRLFYMDSRDSVSLAQFSEGPGSAAWSPDGKTIAFTQFVPGKTPAFATPIAAPKGAEWNAPVRVFDDMSFRFDGAGYLREGATHVFTLSTDGGSVRQITSGEVDFSNPQWLGQGTLLVQGNMAEDRDMDPVESEIYAVNLSDLSLSPLTSRDGPDGGASVSPDGSRIAYVGYDDMLKAYQDTRLYIMDADGSNKRQLAAEIDSSFGGLSWSSDNRTIYAQVENKGVIDVIAVGTGNGRAKTVATNIGGTSIGRPYASGSFSISQTDTPTVAFTIGSTDKPADIAVQTPGRSARTLTDLNADLLPYLDMATVEEIKVASSVDGIEIEAWVALPADFKADGSFPLILEIHGGPNTMYGPYFASEIQRYAAEGYVTVYVNPRGSTGYGQDFAQLIDLAYPGDDYQDLMDIVDSLVERSYADSKRLFVTGGSGGGILTAWTVGKTDRFAAAASVKPVINWMTMALAADIGQYVRRHWIRADPWKDPAAYLDFSPIMMVDKVTTPTLMMVGEQDFRTPAWEAEQFYTGLKMNGVDTALIRVPDSPHYIASRPSRLIAKTDNIMGWFAKYDPAKMDATKTDPSD
ncbi:acyl-peptide hydrolase [Algimonas arctica]|uniref:Acyl-peptide hydrolase n=1 Tax=Algimonas arctica TaxID=1479486 RepID=A0A8J3CR36_9PROT|nr:S9 family peptidase [Algimonas arctica]GHA94608.1 acyl-peptide hydrolase [Algimonas arctica]